MGFLLGMAIAVPAIIGIMLIFETNEREAWKKVLCICKVPFLIVIFIMFKLLVQFDERPFFNAGHVATWNI